MDLPEDVRTEAECARRAAAGNLEAMETIYNQHRAMAFAVGIAVCGNAGDADDVVQETFLRAFRKLGQWRGESQLGTWLYSIALRTAQNWRTRFARKAAPVAAAEGVAWPEETGEADEKRRLLMAAIRELPEQQRLTLTLKHVRGLSIREIAALQGCAEGTVKANLHHAVTGLMHRLSGRPE